MDSPHSGMMAANEFGASPRRAWSRAAASIGPSHLKHRIGTNFEIVAPAAATHNRARQRCLVHAVLDEGLVDVNGAHFAEREPRLHFRAVRALQLNDLR